MRRALLTLGTLLAAACSGARPAADSAAVRVDSAAPAAAAPAVPDTAGATSPTDTSRMTPGPPAGRPAPSANPTPSSTGSDTAGRPRLTPRPPHPVPRPMPRGEDTTPGIRPGGGAQASDQAALDRLMREARALAHAEGCTAADQCAVLPLGERACGGPEDYVVYCPRSTDVAALKAKAAELARAQKAFNAKYQLVSTCEFRQPPTATIVGGACRASRASGAPAVPR